MPQLQFVCIKCRQPYHSVTAPRSATLAGICPACLEAEELATFGRKLCTCGALLCEASERKHGLCVSCQRRLLASSEVRGYPVAECEIDDVVEALR